MTRRLPNFSALRAFEAAARHENFSRAAAELQLTHGAISHQVRGLEEELGRQLFVRHGRQVKITHDGLQFAQFLGKAFADIAAATDAMRAASISQRLTIVSLPSFAAHWLTPRLGRFIELHPEIEVVMQSSARQELARDAVAVGLRLGRGNERGLELLRLMAAPPAADDYYLATPPGAATLPQVLAFRRWLLEEVEAFQRQQR